MTPAEHLTVPVYPFAVWIMAAFDPVLILVSLALGWTANQFGKLFLAAIAGLAVSVLVSWAITGIGLPWPAPIGSDLPTFLPVRTVASFLWALAAYGVRRVVRPRT